MMRWLATAILIGSLACPVAWALDDITTADAIAIKEAVQSQLDAFSKDDASRAFDLATTEKRMLLGSPDNFLRMVKDQYSPIYRPHEVILSQPEVVEGAVIQLAGITDSEDRVWVAIFLMQQEGDSSWKIDSCQLLETTSVVI